MDNTNTQTNNKSAKSNDCPCMDMNEKYAKGFNDDDLIIEDDEIDFADDSDSSNSQN